MAHSHVLGNAKETNKHKWCSRIPVRHTHKQGRFTAMELRVEQKSELLCLAVCGSVGVCEFVVCVPVRQLCVPTCNKYL